MTWGQVKKRLHSHETLWVMIQIMTLMVWVFSIVGTFHCTFIMVGESFDTTDNISRQQLLQQSNFTSTNAPFGHPIGMGLYSTSVYDADANLLGCVSYYGTTDEFDGAFRAARIFSMVTVLCTTIALICVFLVTLFLNAQIPTTFQVWKSARFSCFASFVCQLLTFMAFGRKLCSSNECRPGPASILSIINLFLLAALSALIYVVPPVRTPLFVRSKQKPMSVIEVEKENNEQRKDLHDGVSCISSKNKVDSLGGNQACSGLESDNDEENDEDITPVIMEGIECVEADHRRIYGKNWWRTLAEGYNDYGQKDSARIVVGISICLSWIFAIVGISRCTFLLVGATGQDRMSFSGLGLFNRAYYMNDDILGCISYSPSARNKFDGPLEVGRAFAVFNVILMTISFLSYFILHGFMQPSGMKNTIWLAAAQVTIPCAFISQLIVFSAFRTEGCTGMDHVDCVPGVTGIVAILNTFLQFSLSVLIFSISTPSRPLFHIRTPLPHLSLPPVQYSFTSHAFHNQDSGSKQNYNRGEQQTFDNDVRVRHFEPEVNESIEVTAINEKDGKRITTKEIRHADGSTTITTTVE